VRCRRLEGELGGCGGFCFALEKRFGGGMFSTSPALAFCLPEIGLYENTL
jgi:hypothetical protein